MGNTQTNTNNSSIIKTPYRTFIENYNLPNRITKNDLLVILKNFDQTFINRLCNYYVKDDEIIENDFSDIIDNLNFKSSEQLFRFLFKLLNIDESIGVDEIRLLFQWVSLSVDRELCDNLSNSFRKFSDSSRTDDFLAWIERNFADLGLDFSRSIWRVLKCGHERDATDCGGGDPLADVERQFGSAIIGVSGLFTLFGCLPQVYKMSRSEERLHVGQCRHWCKLYSSDSQGLSASKFKEMSFDYNGPLLILIKSSSGVYCLASDVGLREDWNSYGGADSRLFQLSPIYQRILSGSRSDRGGIIYSHFSAKSGRRGLFIGHNPLKSPAFELNEDFNSISVCGKSEPLVSMETWAVGADVDEKTEKLRDIRRWERGQVDKYKNRKIKSETWSDNPDRHLLDLGGVNVCHTDLIGGHDNQPKDSQD